ncbi:MAG TPA: protein tyrosine kinase, partial [Rhodospirillales bacterium]|nr:protein tyrosine kinase [Rhodospirillales bacterium]
MERIKEAIEKAKAIRRQDQAGHSKVPDAEMAVVGDVEKITYRQTSVVQLDPLHLEENRIISFSKNDPRSMSFDILRTQVLRKMQENSWRTLAITSPTAECGKTVVSINLALSIAQQTEQTVLLVDFDLRKPRVAQYLGLPPGLSLVDYLEENAELAEVFVNPGVPRLTLLPNGSPIENASETLTTARMKALVSDIRDRYD